MSRLRSWTVVGRYDSNEDAIATAVMPGDVAVTFVNGHDDGAWVEVVKAESPYAAANLAVNVVEAVES